MNPIAIVIFAFVVVANAAILPSVGRSVPGQDATATVLRSESVVNPDSFQYTYETSNGINAHASGQLKQITKDESAIVHQGNFAYTDPDGTPIKIDYVADENGYQPSGAHLPVSPPIPAPIARSLEYIATHPYTGP